MRKGITTIIAMAILVSMLLVGFSGTQVAAEPGSMRGYWRFDTGIGSEAVDSSDAMNHGTLSGGKFGNALEFDGVDDYVEIPHTTSLDITNQITVEAWINLDTVNPGDSLGGTIIRKGAWPIVDPPPTWGFDIKYGKLRAFIYDEGTAYIANGATVLSDGVWNAVAFTYDGSNVQIYLNGVPDGSPTSHMGDIDSTSAPVWIGRKDQMDFFDGLIDEVRISNSVRYTGSFTPQTNAFTSDEYTAALWHFDESVGTTASDDSSNSNHGTINGATWAGPTWVGGMYGKGLQFDGVDDYVDCGSDASLAITDAITLEAWVYLHSWSGSWDRVLAKTASGAFSYIIGISANYRGVYFGLFTGTAQTYIRGQTAIPMDTWTHIAGTWDGTTMKIYIDGAEQPETKTFSGPITVTATHLYIGWDEYGEEKERYLFEGIIDEVRIWDKALTSCQIHLAMSGKMEILPKAGLVIYDSSIHGIKDGDTVKICILADHDLTGIDYNPHRHVTPKKSTGSIDNIIAEDDGYRVTVHQDDAKCKTIHLWVDLDTGEHFAVNLHFER